MIFVILTERKAKLKWNSANRKRYVDLGYEFTGWGKEFFVEIKHLTPTTRAIIYYECDYCGEVNEGNYKNYKSLLIRSTSKKITCGKDECVSKKRIESNLSIYGYESHNSSPEVQKKKIQTIKAHYGEEYVSSSQVKEIREKIKNTNIEKYGVTNVFSSEQIKEKIVETNRVKYGVDYFTQTDEFKEKSKETSLEKYGVENPSQSEEFKKRARETNLKKYGVPVATQNAEVQKKIRKTLFENNSAPSSFQQKYLHSLLGGVMNYPVSSFSIDIAFPQEKIAIEYDGGGHWLSVSHGNITMEEFNKKELKRNYFLYRRGWRIIRIISRKDFLPTESEIITLVNECKEYLETGRHWIEVDIDNQSVKCSQYQKELLFTTLKKVSSRTKVI